MAADQPIAYGVWIRGQGWLKVGDKERFADENQVLAESAASFFGARASVKPIDDTLITLESVFLESEMTLLDRLAKRVKQWQLGQR